MDMCKGQLVMKYRKEVVLTTENVLFILLYSIHWDIILLRLIEMAQDHAQ